MSFGGVIKLLPVSFKISAGCRRPRNPSPKAAHIRTLKRRSARACMARRVGSGIGRWDCTGTNERHARATRQALAALAVARRHSSRPAATALRVSL